VGVVFKGFFAPKLFIFFSFFLFYFFPVSFKSPLISTFAHLHAPSLLHHFRPPVGNQPNMT
jgi:hypothetical protein